MTTLAVVVLAWSALCAGFVMGCTWASRDRFWDKRDEDWP